MRILRLLVATAVTLLVVLAPAAAAGPPAGSVAGYYTYYPFGGTSERTIAVFARGNASVKGTWARIDGTTGAVLRAGLVTCLVIDGTDAWMAGPEIYRADGRYVSEGSFLQVHDGGQPGPEGDFAVTWFGDPGQPLAELVGWCENRNTPVELFPLASGDVAVHANPGAGAP
jgi:hypothetical protein